MAAWQPKVLRNPQASVDFRRAKYHHKSSLPKTKKKIPFLSIENFFEVSNYCYEEGFLTSSTVKLQFKVMITT